MGEVIKQARKKAGLTQKELAIAIGCAEVTIRQYESNRREPSYEMCCKLESILNTALVAHIDDKNSTQIVNFDKELICSAVNIIAKSVTEDTSDIEVLKNTPEYQALYRINEALAKLNSIGVLEAVKRVEELTELSKYQKGNVLLQSDKITEGQED